MCLSGIWGIHLPTFTSTNSNGTKFVPVVSESRRCLLPKVNIYLTKQFVRCSVYCACVSGYGWCPEAGVVLYGKRTNFSFDKAENTETVYVYIFQSDPRSRCLLLCRRSSHRETRWYSDNADVVFSVADVSLSSADSRSTVLS